MDPGGVEERVQNLVCRDVSLQQLVFLQQVVDRGQIFAIIFRSKKSFNLRNNNNNNNSVCVCERSAKVHPEVQLTVIHPSPQIARSQSP